MRPKVFIPIREESGRLPNRPFRQVGPEPLWRHILRKFSAFEIFVDTDSRVILDSVPGDPQLAHVHVYEREAAHRDPDLSVNELIRQFLQRYGIRHEVIGQMHITTPFLRPETLQAAFAALAPGSAYDSVLACTRHQARFWYQDAEGFVPINHNPMVLRRTSRLAHLYADNSCFYLFPAESFLRTQNRLGVRPHFFEVPFPENLVVATEDDWERCLQFIRSGWSEFGLNTPGPDAVV